MAKKVTPFKEPKPDKAFKAMTAGEVLRDLKAKMPTSGKKPSAPPMMRGAGGRAGGGGGRKKTAKTPEQLDKELQAYGPAAKTKFKKPADAVMKGKKITKTTKTALKKIPFSL